MGAIGGMLGLSGGEQGTGISGPAMPALTTVATPEQLGTAYGGVQNSLQSQQGLLQALQGQNGIGNQNQVYGQLQGIANGTGPNPAQMQYQQNINQLAAQQAGLLGSQKGISPALQARLVAQQGASAMQTAAGQGAANLANQQLNAIGMSGNLATTQAGQQIGQTNANNAAAQSSQNALLNAANGQNNAMVGAQGSVNAANAGNAQQVMKGQGDAIGGLLSGAGKAMMMAAGGGSVTDVFGGSIYQPQTAAPPVQNPQEPQSSFGKFINGISPTQDQGPMTKGFDNLGKGLGKVLGGGSPAMAQGGQVPALVSPGEVWLPPENVKQVAGGKNPLEVGERIPGKPKVQGNSYSNDVVPKNLDVGGIVIPNSVMQSKDPAKASAEFVAKIIAKRKGKS